MGHRQPRRPAGIPTGGQFAPTDRPEAVGIALVDDDGPCSPLDTDDAAEPFGLDELVPQANSVSKIAAVLDAVAAGCVEAGDIAEAIGVSVRQGAYYPYAAEALGLLTQVGTHPLEWGLSPAGEALFKSPADERAEAMAEILADDEHVATFVDDGPGALAERWSHLSESTVERRLQTIRAWVAFAYETPAAEQAALVGGERDSARALAPVVRSRAEARRAAARRPVRRCPSCNLELPSGSDRCSLCD